MKRILALTLACAMTFALLASCGRKKDPAPEASNPAGPSESVPEAGKPDASVPESGSPDASAPEADKSEPAEPDTSAPGAAEPEEPRPQLTLNKNDFSLFKVGATFQLKVAGAEKDAEVKWSSDKEAVASVDEKGLVTYVAPGSAVITAEVSGEKLTCTVRCKADETSEAVKPEEKPVYESVDLKAFYGELEKLMDKKFGEDGAPAMMPMDDDMIANFYPGLTDLDPRQVVIAGPMISAVVSEFALAEARNAEDAEKIAAIFQARIDAQAGGGAWYPATVEGWKQDAKVVTNGSYVMMVAIEDNADYIAAFNNLFK